MALIRNLSLLLITLLITTVHAQNHHHVSRTPTPATATDTAAAAALCASAKFPALCQWLVATYHPKTTNELRDAAIEDTIKKAGLAKTKAGAMARGETDEIVARRINGCVSAFDDVATSLTDAQNYLKSGDEDQARVYVDAAASLVETCHDVFDYDNGGVDFPTKRLYQHTKKVSTYAISFFHIE